MASGHRSILIAGAGATGLTAALELARRGHVPRIVDSDTGPVSLTESRALGINARTLTLLSPSRVSDTILQECQQIARFRITAKGRQLVDLDTTKLPGPYGAIYALAQGHTERLLLGKLSDYEIVPEWQTVVETLSGDLSRPTVVLRKPDGSVETADFDIVIGADGSRSAVRKAVGIEFPGQSLESSFYLADFRYALPIDPGFAEISLVDPGIIGRIPVTRDVLRYISTLADFEGRIQHPAPVAERVWASVFRIHFRHVDTMAKGNVFLAGDAAHIHSPAGARGMNLGIEDACWLAWLISEGRQQEYAELRMPAVKRVMKQTYQLTSLITMRNPVAIAIRDLAAPLILRIPAFSQKLLRSVSGYDTQSPPWIDGAL
ncbi:2-polyprenyl-6-methoxyphenol hydroxylase-like FAD-dependent oxidoreductase [Rhizobium mesoamericanum]|uniref:FAD-dependent oxidoreductase n=1 Tax=Rhizobium mesoamericanum TaxID=1079800 RepID=UPI002786888C|nr:NAD(P)/FAD-dependent oxidoreductase [Rhizobium mesoamericanum]MDQ0561414.1 2-polyprenyl-6-methoxyphenol hydroxylase-like FAD-dependent oxidoreductase [Rhizobium mesoamericanum]